MSVIPCRTEKSAKIPVPVRFFYLVGHELKVAPHGLVELDGLASGGGVASPRQRENHGSEGHLSVTRTHPSAHFIPMHACRLLLRSKFIYDGREVSDWTAVSHERDGGLQNRVITAVL